MLEIDPYRAFHISLGHNCSNCSRLSKAGKCSITLKFPINPEHEICEEYAAKTGKIHYCKLCKYSSNCPHAIESCRTMGEFLTYEDLVLDEPCRLVLEEIEIEKKGGIA